MATSPYQPTNPYNADSEISLDVGDKRGSKQIIVALLAEYSAKLINKTGQLEGVKYRGHLWLCIYISIGISGGLIDYVVLKSPFFSISYVFIASLSIFPVLAFLYILEIRRSSPLKEEIAILSLQLTRLVERASAIEEHSKLNFGEYFELDFRLQDAEIALHRAKTCMGATAYKYVMERLESEQSQYRKAP